MDFRSPAYVSVAVAQHIGLFRIYFWRASVLYNTSTTLSDEINPIRSSQQGLPSTSDTSKVGMYVYEYMYEYVWVCTGMYGYVYGYVWVCMGICGHVVVRVCILMCVYVFV